MNSVYRRLDIVSRIIGTADQYQQLDGKGEDTMAAASARYDELMVLGDFLKLVGKIASQPSPPVPPPVPARAPQPLSPTLDELLVAQRDGKITAIKAYRTRTGLGLKESKDNIERAANLVGWSFGPSPYAPGPAFDAEVFPF